MSEKLNREEILTLLKLEERGDNGLLVYLEGEGEEDYTAVGFSSKLDVEKVLDNAVPMLLMLRRIKFYLDNDMNIKFFGEDKALGDLLFKMNHKR
jgi:hypothetical protein